MTNKTQQLKCAFGIVSWPRCCHCGTPVILNVDGTASGEWEPIDNVVRKIFAKLVKGK